MTLNTDEVQAWAEGVETNLGLKAFSVFFSRRHLQLWMFEVPKENRKQGIGSQAMRMLTDYADKHELMITLSPGLEDPHHGTTSRARLLRFYRRFGFVRNRGRTIDFTISDDMYRKPKRPRP